MPKSSKYGPEYSPDREIKVILEDMQSQFRVFGEGLQNVREELHTFRQEVREELRTGNRRLDGVETSLSRFFTTLSDHETRLTSLEKR